MRVSHHPALLALVLALSACGNQPAPDAGAPSFASVSAPAPLTTQGDTGMQKDCQGTGMHLTALAAADGASRQTRLEIERDGQRRAIDKPEEMKDYTAVGLGCVQDQAGAPYFVVQYGELPYGCEFCEWYYLYDAAGKQLTHSIPPLREEDGRQAPNNDEYARLLGELGIEHPEVDPFTP